MATQDVTTQDVNQGMHLNCVPQQKQIVRLKLVLLCILMKASEFYCL